MTLLYLLNCIFGPAEIGESLKEYKRRCLLAAFLWSLTIGVWGAVFIYCLFI